MRVHCVKKYLYFLFVLFVSVVVRAQQISSPNIANTAATPSPVASALNRQNQIPVNHYTGIPQISIPIYSSAGHSIALSYFAGGNRVDEMPGNTGLGWNLNAGGAITRVVQGLPDDMPNVGWIFTQPVTFDSIRHEFICLDIECESWYLNTVTVDKNQLYYNNTLDGEWDIFQFNVNGLSGKFYISKGAAHIVTVPQQKIKIIPSFNWSLGIEGGSIESFTIIDQQGNRYVFNERELTTLTNSSGNSGLYGIQHITAWYISQIIPYNNNGTTTFQYENKSTSRLLQFPPVSINRLSGNIPPAAETTINTGTCFVQGKRLSSISFPDLSIIHFVYDTIRRCDFRSENALREINIRYNNNFVKGYKLDYMYFTRTGNAAYGGVCNNNGFDHRLQLKSVTEYNSAIYKAPTVFHYDDSKRLPSIFSPAQDHWGFFNGAHTNFNLVPALTVPFFTGANRNPDSSFTAAGILNAIYYSSGAVTLLEYEQNKANTVLRNLVESPAITIPLNAASSNPVNSSFMKIYAGPTKFRLWCNSPNIWQFNDGSTYNVVFRNVNAGNSIIANFNMTVADVRAQKIFELPLPAGNYTISITITLTSFTPNNAQTANNLRVLPLIFSWENESMSTTDQLIGGLRIKRITDFDGINTKPVSQREFEYVKTNSLSSGFISLIPKYDYIRHLTKSNANTSTSTYITRHGTPVNNLHYTQGSPVGYERVVEYYGAKTKNIGYTVYEFTSYNNQNITPDNTYYYPYLPNQTPDWILGLPLKTEQFDADGKLLNRIENTFAMVNNAPLPVFDEFRALKVGTSSENFWFGSPNHNFILRNYFPVTGRAELTSVRSTSFEQTASMTTDTIIQSVTYQYDPIHFVPVQTSSTSNKKAGEWVHEYIYYPFHYTGITTGPVQQMKQDELIVPLSSETWLQRGSTFSLIGTEVTEMQQFGSKLLPFRVHTLQTSSPVPQSIIQSFNPSLLVRNNALIVPQTEQTVFSAKDKPLEVRNMITGLYNSVIYDHHNEITVARIENARNNEVAYTSFEADGKGNWNYTGTPVTDPVRSVMGRRFYNLSSGTVTSNTLPAGKTYKLSLWSRSGTVNITGASAGITEANAATGWTYREFTANGGSTITISGTAQIDELRLLPVNASMATENYDPTVGLLSACDANNKISYNDYDNQNRILFQRDQDYNIIKAYSYTEPSTGVNTTPNWQYATPAVTSCAKVTGTNYNTGELLQQQRDVNPSSITFNSIRWASSGSNTGACPIVPDWQQTTLECEVNAYGAKTGKRISVQQDMNPASPTFNQIRRINIGFDSTSCSITTIYASIEIRNVLTGAFSNVGTWKTADLYVVLKDAEGNPLNVQNITINLQEVQNYNGFVTTNNSFVTVNGTEALVFSGLIEEFTNISGGGTGTYTFTMSVLPGTGYVAQ